MAKISIFFLLILFTVGCCPEVFAQKKPDENKLIEQEKKFEDNQITLAKKFIEKDKGKEALMVLGPLLYLKPSYDPLILTAQAFAEINMPFTAMQSYKAALRIAKDHEEVEVAKFGIAKMQFWGSQYVRAANTYRSLLKMPLNKEDRELATAGLVKSLAYYDRPRKAFAIIPKDLKPTKPEMVVAAAQASLWSDWPDITQYILAYNRPIINKIKKDSPLYRDLSDVKWQADLGTSPNVFTPTYFYSTDTEDFIKRWYSYDLTHYWNYNFQSSAGFENISYTQTILGDHLSAGGVYLGQTIRGRDLTFKGRIEATNYGNWHPPMWVASAIYQPNDYLKVELLSQREIVETFPAFVDHIYDDLYTGGITINPLPYVKLTASWNKLKFKDENIRIGRFFSASYLILPDVGLSIIEQMRGWTDRFQTPDYFSPAKYNSFATIFKISRKVGAVWHVYADIGFGRQTIVPSDFDVGESGYTDQEGFGLTGPLFKHVILSIYYTRLHQASPFRNSNDYTYQFGSASLNILF